MAPLSTLVLYSCILSLILSILINVCLFNNHRVHRDPGQAGRSESSNHKAAQMVRGTSRAHPGCGAGPNRGVACLRLSQWRPLPSTHPASNDGKVCCVFDQERGGTVGSPYTNVLSAVCLIYKREGEQ